MKNLLIPIELNYPSKFSRSKCRISSQHDFMEKTPKRDRIRSSNSFQSIYNTERSKIEDRKAMLRGDQLVSSINSLNLKPKVLVDIDTMKLLSEIGLQKTNLITIGAESLGAIDHETSEFIKRASCPMLVLKCMTSSVKPNEDTIFLIDLEQDNHNPMKSKNYTSSDLDENDSAYSDASKGQSVQGDTFSDNFQNIIGKSDEMKDVFRKIRQVADTDATVLITGETGTGKELIAAALHRLSSRSNKPYIKINCAALPAEMIESELFGHEKGSFTGATHQRIGKFELANDGTIFLDEIGEMPLKLQVKLLRVLQEREIERIGGSETIKLNVRIITATNKFLQKEVDENKFRADLFYRLNVFQILAPPLRERKSDIVLLANHFLKSKSQKIGKNIVGMSAQALDLLAKYSWPGNVRELEHTIERSIIMANGILLDIKIALDDIRNERGHSIKQFDLKTLDDYQKDAILFVLDYTKGKIRGEGGAAEILGLRPNTLDARMKKLGIIKSHDLE